MPASARVAGVSLVACALLLWLLRPPARMQHTLHQELQVIPSVALHDAHLPQPQRPYLPSALVPTPLAMGMATLPSPALPTVENQAPSPPGDDGTHALRCAALLEPRDCERWYARRDWVGGSRASVAELRLGTVSRQCAAGCNDRGVCDQLSGVCACEAGYNGSACEGVNVRGCNGETDGLWHASHCAGECDERTGYCWCPGRLRDRPMSDTCQAKLMPVDVFAALTLKPDPEWAVYARNGSVLLKGVGGLPAERRNQARDRLAIDLQHRTHDLARQPQRRAKLIERWWFGGGGGRRAGARQDGEGDAGAWHVEISPHGMPHAVKGAERGGTAAVRPSDAHGAALIKKLAARSTHLPHELLVADDESGPNGVGAARRAGGGKQRARLQGQQQPWCQATVPSQSAKKCACTYDGLHGPLCDGRHEPFCLNQCSGHGECDPLGGGFCRCDAGYFGIDCSMTTRASDGRVTLHAQHAALRRPRAPSVYVYELWDHTSLILQYRAYRGYCVHRYFRDDNRTEFNDGYAYTIETALHEWLLASPHRTLDADAADYFYVPTYLACTILPVFDWVGPGPFSTGYPMRPVTAMRMAHDALQQVRSRWPYFNRSISRGVPDHLFLFSHDEGACWAPLDLYQHSIILTHWGRRDLLPHSSSRYIPDNWEHQWFQDERSPAGQRWTFPRPGGSRGMIGMHPCYTPSKDVVIPVYSPPNKWKDSPFVAAAATLGTSATAASATAAPSAGAPRDGDDRIADEEPRTTLAYFSGNLGENEPLKYGRGIRHRLRQSFRATPGWRLVGKAGWRYSMDLASSEFCLVPPGGDGWSSRVDDAVRHGCIPVIIMDNVHMPFETSLNYSSFSIRVAEADVEQLDGILRSVGTATRRAMRAVMRRLWTRFTYARSHLDVEAYLPQRHAADTADRGARVLPREHVHEPPLSALAALVDGGAPDAFDTIFVELEARRHKSAVSQ